MTIQRLLRRVKEKCPDRVFFLEKPIGHQEVDYLMYRNGNSLENENQPIYVLHCSNATSQFVLQRCKMRWIISEDTLRIKAEELIKQIVLEVSGYTPKADRLYI